ncbi:MAG: glycosyltransferase, partial [Chitinivibrionia bacterium]|nr:glycosyltransferase [Chitinivibrionia bacterium]
MRNCSTSNHTSRGGGTGSVSERKEICASQRCRLSNPLLLRSTGFQSEETGFIISNIYAIDAARRLGGGFLLYDCNDSHDAFPGMPPWTKDYFVRTCTHADAVYASSRDLLARVSGIREGKGCAYLGNGVEYDHFAIDEQALLDRVSSSTVRLGYIGAIAPWLDFDILTALARRHPEWEIVLAGPVLLGVEGDVAALTVLPNVHRLEPVSYERVPEILRGFTAGLIPFRYNDLTRGVNPNKLYEYMASGLPVAATAFSPEVLLYPEAVHAAQGEEEFLRACEE